MNPKLYTTRTLYICLVLLTAPPNVAWSSDPESPPVVWNAEDGCPGSDVLMEKVIAVLGETSVLEDGRQFVGSAVREADGWRATLEIRAKEEVLRRSVPVGSCEAATEVVSLLIALAVDPMSVLGSEDENVQASLKTISESVDEPQPIEDTDVPEAVSPETAPVEESPEKTPEPQPKAKPPERAPQTAEPPVREETKVVPRYRWGELGIDFDADVGTDGGFRPGVAILGGFIWKLLRIEVSARYLPRQEASIDGVSGGRYQSRLAGFSLGLGLQWRLGRFRIGPVLGAALHGLFAESSGVVAPGTGTAWFASIWAGGHLEWLATERFGLRFFPSVHYLPEQPRFAIEGVGTVMQPSVVTGSFRLGVFLNF